MTTSAQQFLRKFIPQTAFKGPGWDLILEVIGDSEQLNWDLAEAVERQLFTTTADGKYLDVMGSRSGVSRPTSLEADDELFRDYIIGITSTQMTSESMWKVLEVFFGYHATHASVTSGNTAPFDIVDGSELLVSIDKADPVTITFNFADFSSPATATIAEVVEVCNRVFRDNDVDALASASDDDELVIYSETPGLAGSVRVYGGLAQQTFRFPALVPITPFAGAEELTLTKQNDTVYFKYIMVNDPVLPANSYELIREGDYVLITDSSTDPSNRGCFRIKELVWWGMRDIWELGGGIDLPVLEFILENADGITESLTLVEGGVEFFRFDEASVRDSEYCAYLQEGQDGSFGVSVPAEANVTSREPGTASYLVSSDPIIITNATINTVTSMTVSTGTTDHELAQGDQVLIDGLTYGLVGSSIMTVNQINGVMTVTAVNSDTEFVVQLPPWRLRMLQMPPPQSIDATDGTMQAVNAIAQTGPNPVVYDPSGGLNITSTSSTTTSAIGSGDIVSLLDVADATVFPDEAGFVVVGLGYDYQTLPIGYLGRASGTQLLLDRGYRFGIETPIGTYVNLLTSRIPGQPNSPSTEGVMLSTGTTQGRVDALTAIKNLAGSGIAVVPTIQYPSDINLPGAGLPVQGAQRLSSIVSIYAGDDVDADLASAQGTGLE